MQAGGTGKEEVKQQQRMAVMTSMMRKRKTKGGMDTQNSWWVSDLATDCKKKFAPPRMNGRTQSSNGTIGCMK